MITGRNDLAGSSGDAERSTVEERQGELDSSESLQECDLAIGVEVGALSLVDLVLGDTDAHVEVTGHDAWCLVALSVEGVIVLVWDTLFEADLDDLILVHDTLALALLATVLLFHLDALTAAVRAWAGLLTVHAWAEHNELLDHFFALACRASLGVLAALSITSIARTLARVFQLVHLSFVDLLEYHL